MDLSDSKKKLALAGIICGIVAACLAAFGNPANMAFCIACFIRDTAGALGMHSTATVQYARPEIIGLVLGAFIISIKSVFSSSIYEHTASQTSPRLKEHILDAIPTAIPVFGETSIFGNAVGKRTGSFIEPS